MEKLPPVEKIYEAYSAIADDRIRMGEKKASVWSSDHSKEYIVTWDDNLYTANDNASYWQGYAGYTIIAVLMLQGKLHLDKTIATQFTGINWKVLNDRYRAKYDRAVNEILQGLNKKGVDTNAIRQEVEFVFQQLSLLPVNTKRSSVRPPK